MAQVSSPGDSVNVQCFSFNNPFSANGPAGVFQLWSDGSNVLGRMTIQTIFGVGSTTVMNLQGTSSGTTPVVCTLQGEGFTTQMVNQLLKPTYGTLGMTVSLPSGSSAGSLVFGAEFPEVTGGLPVTLVTDPTPSAWSGEPCCGNMGATAQPSPQIL